MLKKATLKRIHVIIVAVENSKVFHVPSVPDSQHAKRLRHIAICGLSGSTTFFHIIS
jgi:hypothetical protein